MIFPRYLVAKNHRWYIAEQRRTVSEYSAPYAKVQKVGGTSTMFSTCSCKHRQCIFYVIISRMIWVIYRRCSRNVLQSVCNIMAMFSPVCFIFYLHPSKRHTKYANTKVISLFTHDLIRQPHGMWFHMESLLLYALHKALLYGMRSSRKYIVYC